MGSTVADATTLLRAQAHIWTHMFGFIHSMSLKCALQLGIPDIILGHGRSITLSELIRQLPVNPAKSHHVRRLMRTLVESGFFDLSENDQSEEVYSLNYVSEILVRGNPAGMFSATASTMEPFFVDPLHDLAAWFQNDDSTAFRTTHGIEFWEYLGRDHKLNDMFNEVQASDTRLLSTALINDVGESILEGINTLVDVGGGTGAMARAIVTRFPEINYTVLDLPQVVTGLSGDTNLRFVPGDMFKEIPQADAILLKSILHDWGDEESVKILKLCKEAIAKSSHVKKKVMIIDIVIGCGSDNVEGTGRTATQLAFDMMMMALFSGKERTEKEWAKLFTEAGFKDYKIIPVLGWRSLIEVYP